jgi:dTDP-glucose pyrophosphorylase
MLGIIPAAGQGSRIQPLAFSKELLPVGSSFEEGRERPRVVSEYLVERMVRAGADRICFVIGPHKSDIVEYYGGRAGGATAFYVVQEEPRGLCDAIFRALPFCAPNEPVLIGLPDTVWFPEDGFSRLPDDEELSFLLFDVDEPRLFDAVVTDGHGWIEEIQVKDPDARTSWVWGAIRTRGRTLASLAALFHARGGAEPYLGTLVNAWLRADQRRRARGVRAGEGYVDVGTLDGYRRAIRLLQARAGAACGEEDSMELVGGGRP